MSIHNATIRMCINDWLEGQKVMMVRDYSPHMQGEWREASTGSVGIVQRAAKGETDIGYTFDTGSREGKVFEECGCCDGEAGFEFRFVSDMRDDWNLSQL